MKEVYTRRIGYQGKLEDISHAVCSIFDLGEFISNNLVLIGYEDFNFALETTEGKYFVKVFANFRSDRDCQRYVDVIAESVKAKVKTPRLYKSENGYLHKLELHDSNLRLCVMEYIEGQDIFSLRETLNPEEIKTIAQQAALINSIDIKPQPIYDSWAIVNFADEFRKTKNYLSARDLELVEPLVQEFKNLRIKELPHCFVHGDIITTNVMKDKEDKLWIVDFSVSNYYPRIQELAVLACNLFFDPESKTKSEENLNLALAEYQKKIRLTDRELAALPTYIKLAHAMHILGATHSRSVENNTSEENKYWLQQGRTGLEQMLK